MGSAVVAMRLGDVPGRCFFSGFGLIILTQGDELVEIIVRGVLAYVENITLHHGGQLWLNHGGHSHQ